MAKGVRKISAEAKEILDAIAESGRISVEHAKTPEGMAAPDADIMDDEERLFQQGEMDSIESLMASEEYEKEDEDEEDGVTTIDANSTRFPSMNQFRAALLAIQNRLSENQRLMLQHHCRAPKHAITFSQLAEAVAYKDYRGANLQYGKLASLVCDALNWKPKGAKVKVLGTFIGPERRDGHWKLLMRPQVVRALQKLGWT